VNLGGWLVTEPFIVPGLYEQYQDTTPRAQDEYTLSQAMGADLAVKMEEHYKTFIVSILAVAPRRALADRCRPRWTLWKSLQLV
jgi:hypothetical protein